MEQCLWIASEAFGDEICPWSCRTDLPHGTEGSLQTAKKTIHEFGADTARLFRLAYSSVQTNFVERLAVVAFRTEIRRALTLAQPDRLADARARALEIEEAKKLSRIQVQVETADEDNSEESSLGK